jgi:hypothetical protein
LLDEVALVIEYCQNLLEKFSTEFRVKKILLLALISLGTFSVSSAQAAWQTKTVSNTIIVRGVVYVAPTAFTVPNLEVPQTDGSTFLITCEASPATYSGAFGRVIISTVGFKSTRVANTEMDCEKILKDLQQKIKAHAKSLLVVEFEKGKLTVVPQ